ncbi:MAG UNVERIFIED_CONTAM: hypothetical protein LVT10_15620 [Anaerolineae bacterium]
MAFNVYLDMTDVNIAKAIAKSIRESSGGLPYVKALGLFVNGRAQVSMNLVNFQVTGLFPVVEAIRQQAEAHGVKIERSEVVGLLPQQAVQDALMDYLKLPREVGGWTIEQRLGRAEQVIMRPFSLSKYLLVVLLMAGCGMSPMATTSCGATVHTSCTGCPIVHP